MNSSVEIPNGAIENGRAFLQRLVDHYDFTCEAGSLANCTDYHEAVRCFEHITQWVSGLSAAPHLAAVRVNVDEIVQPLEDIHAPGGLCRWTDVATAIGEVRRALSALEPSAAREVALEDEEFAIDKLRFRAFHTNSDTDRQAYFDAVSKWFQDRHIRRMNAERALFSPDHADAGKVEVDGWMPIEIAPKDGTEIWGCHKVAAPAQTRFYDGEWCCVDWDEDQYIACTWEPTHWRPLPSAPASEGAE